MLVEVEFESGTVRAEGTGVGLLAGVREDVVPQALLEVAPDKQLVAERAHQCARGPHNPLQHTTTPTSHNLTTPCQQPQHKGYDDDNVVIVTINKGLLYYAK